jgi:cytochrome c biogenesis protein CcmG/thiol:disulfide interchange protein DsbE
MTKVRFQALLALLIGGAVSLGACGGDTAEPQVREPPVAAGKPASLAPELQALRAQANRLLDGGPEAFERRLRELRGHPVVVNQWASWCGPCRFEFPFFQRLARRYEGRVAFLGVDSQDARADAEEFLRELPVPFPSYYDKDASIARLFGGGRAWPTTAFYDASGKLTRTHLGAYASEAKLDEDVRRYALGG